jgi:hypothetical protein
VSSQSCTCEEKEPDRRNRVWIEPSEPVLGLGRVLGCSLEQVERSFTLNGTMLTSNAASFTCLIARPDESPSTSFADRAILLNPNHEATHAMARVRLIDPTLRLTNLKDWFPTFTRGTAESRRSTIQPLILRHV